MLLLSKAHRHLRQYSKVAVILNGCGHLDGNDVLETSCLDLALAKNGHTVSYFAPFDEIPNSYIYTSRKVDTGEERYSHKEASRLVHSTISNLKDLKPMEYSALVIPGGDGVLTNLSNYLSEPSDFAINSRVTSIVKEFHASKKTIVATAQSALLVGMILGTKNGGPGITVTFGGNEDSHAPACRLLGNDTAEIKDPKDFHLDEKNAIVSSPISLWEGISVLDLWTVTEKVVANIK
jgi:enhancing lycopene biosynthesis protein 2